MNFTNGMWFLVTYASIGYSIPGHSIWKRMPCVIEYFSYTTYVVIEGNAFELIVIQSNLD
jgi:hypothetical protein